MISSVYHYYMSQYGNTRTQSKYDTHKKSELRNVYNNIMKANSKAPFYKVDLSVDAQKFAIDVKENALALSSVLDEISDESDSNFKKLAYSSNEDVLEAKFVGSSSGSYPDVSIDVKSTATPQINTGTYLAPQAKALPSGHYSFDVDIANVTYEFQYTVGSNDTNIDIQNKLARLINNSNIGLNASLSTDTLGNNALVVSSNATGIIDEDSPVIFTVDDDSSPERGSVAALGLNHTTQYPQDALFTVNGEERTSSSNNFILGKAYDITLKSASDSPVTLGLKADTDSMIDNIKNMVHGYNSMIDLSKNQSVASKSTSTLYKDFSSIAKAYHSILSQNGLNISEDGKIDIDSTTLENISKTESMSDILKDFKNFKNDLKGKADSAVLDPMAYANKIIVSYKNPKLTLNSPYSTSVYSGMMFNGYI